ncbi:FtsX-like permease family protein [Deinococcus hohokamensis]|uniref:FtsX-like permease family protein n=1 Tax=Deinococcus hohokamensis TaxID=309883 RepID=A0ABV9I6J5_9DEIO
MLSLFAADFKHHASQWFWTLVVATVGGACLGMLLTAATSLAAWALTQPHRPELLELAEVARGQVSSYICIATATVVASTANLTITAQSREYALWKVLGIPRWQISTVILLQLLVVGLLGGLIGGLLSPLGTPVYLHMWGELAKVVVPIPVTFNPTLVPVVAGVMSVITVLGGFGPAQRGGALPEMQALRESEAPHVRVGLFSRLLAGLMLLTAGIFWAIPRLSHSPDAQIPAAILGGTVGLLLVVAALLVGPWTVRPLLFAWTALIPAQSPAWFTAREACRHRSGQSMATIMPFAIAVALTGTMFGMASAGPGVNVSGFLVIFSLVFTISAVGGVANIVLVGRQRGRDLALLRVLGASDRTLAAVPVLEGMVYALTGILFGVGATVLTVALGALAVHQPLLTALVGLPWLSLAGLSLGSLALAIGAVVLSVRRAHRAPVMEQLRQPT